MFQSRLAGILGLLLSAILSDQASALYDPSVGRFCSRDPIGYEDGINTYKNNFSMQEMDPTGQATVRSLFEEPYVPIPLPEDERNKLKDCKCNWNPNVPQGGFGWVECNGRGGFRVVTQPIENLPPEYTDCEVCDVASCVRSHEERHTDQFATFCPNACRGKWLFVIPCTILEYDFPLGGAVGFEPGKCRDQAECHAYKVEIDCLEKLRFAKSTKRCKTSKARCNDFIKDVIAGKQKAAEAEFHCKATYGIDLAPTKKPKA